MWSAMDDASAATGREEPVDPVRALVLFVFTLGLAIAFIALVIVDQVSASSF